MSDQPDDEELYWIKSEETEDVIGPLTIEELKVVVERGRISVRDSISREPDGPWQLVSDARKGGHERLQKVLQNELRMIENATISKSITGKITIKFDCPKCHKSLVSERSDIGREDHCPFCNASFAISGKFEQQLRAEELGKQRNEAARRELERERILERKKERAARREATHQLRLWAEQRKTGSVGCPHCGILVYDDVLLNGDRTHCPLCRQEFTVPNVPTMEAEYAMKKLSERAVLNMDENPILTGCGILFLGATFIAFCSACLILPYLESETHSESSDQFAEDVDDLDSMEDEIDSIITELQSTPEGRQAIRVHEAAENKDRALTRFQLEYGISDENAEAAIREWMHINNPNGSGLLDLNWNWNLEEVKQICLRNKRNGIPTQ